MGLEKINELKKAKGLTNKKLAEMTGISISSLDKITAGDNTNPKFATIKLICDALGCTLDDLSDNNHSAKANNHNSLAEEAILTKYRALDYFGRKAVDELLNIEYARCTFPNDNEQPTIQIRHSNYKVSAGTGFDLSEGDDWGDMIDVPDTPEARKADFAITIQGRSMEPVYFNGDIILVKKQDDIDFGQIGIFRVNGSGYIKKKGEGSLISLNDEYPDILIGECDEYGCVGKVIGRV